MAAKRFLLGVGFVALFFVVAAGVSLGAVAYAYHGKFYPGVQVAGVSLAGRTADEGRAMVAQKADSYTAHAIRMTVPDLTKPKDDAGNYPDLEIDAKAQDLGFAVGVTQAADTAWSVGHSGPLHWLAAVVPSLFSGRNVALPYVIDNPAIQTYVHTQILPNIATPKPAVLAVNDGVAAVTASTPGLQVDEAGLASQLASHLQDVTDAAPIWLRIPAAIAESPIQTAAVQPLADQLNAVGAMKVSFVGTAVRLQPTRTQLVSWFSPVQDQQGKLGLALQKDAVLAFLKTNKSVDTDKSLAPAVTALVNLASGTVPATLSLAVVTKPSAQGAGETTAGSYTLGRFPGKYIEVNLAEQKLYQINGTTLEKTFLVSTGKASTPTPVGQFYIGNRSPRAFSYLYGLYMPWWQSFLNNEYGLHELPEWPNGYKEGEGHLGIPVSDGCVRLGTGAAKEVYDWTETGTPVYIH